MSILYFTVCYNLETGKAIYEVKLFGHFVKIINIKIIFIVLAALSGCMVQTSRLGVAVEPGDENVGYIAAILISKQISKGAPMLLPKPPVIVANFSGTSSKSNLSFKLHTFGADQWNNPSKTTDNGGEYCLMLLVPVQPGQYWLDGVDTTFYSGYSLHTQLRAPYPTIIIKKGEITYGGRIEVVSAIGKNIAGEVRPGEIFLKIVDHFNDDIGIMKPLDSKLRTLPVSNGLK